MNTNTLLGLNIIESPHVQPVPVLQLRPQFVWCSDEFRAEMNAWLLEMFGTKEVMYVFDGRALGLNSSGIFMNPKHIAMIKNLRSFP